jgi:hypothetical protein
MVDTATPTYAPPKPDRRLREFERFHRYLGHKGPDAGLRRGQRDRWRLNPGREGPGNVPYAISGHRATSA